METPRSLCSVLGLEVRASGQWLTAEQALSLEASVHEAAKMHRREVRAKAEASDRKFNGAGINTMIAIEAIKARAN